MNVLVTSLGSNTAIGVVKALRHHPQISVTGTDTFPAHLSAGSSFADHFYQVPLAVSGEYEAALLRIVEEQQIQCVIPIHDAEVMKIAGIAEKHPDRCFWAVNKPGIISQCNDKREINGALAEQGIVVPHMVGEGTEITYPVIYKPANGVSSKGIRVIRSAAENTGLFDLANGFFQRLVEGEEYTVDCYSAYREDFFSCCVRKRIETKEGISTKGVTVDFPLLGELSARIHAFLKYRGASNIQFIVEEGIPYFIEINPRFSGAGVLSYHAGLNSPLLTVFESVGSPLFDELKKQPVRSGVYMTRYWNENFYES